ncbi:MAG: hypothetical protein IPP97_14805 [Candidatus Obscuribacter sp.]|nr:hypothetical protein [Candidatus Obscuribacter sp.]
MSELRSIPTEDDWKWPENQCPYYHRDVEWAHDKFAGKSIEQVEDYFFESVLSASEDISYMPKIPFQFYIFAYTRYLLDKRTFGEDYRLNTGASEGASSFLGLVKEKLVWLPNHIVPIMPELLPAIEFVCANQALYDADEKIYGSFRELEEQIKTLYAKHSGSI